MRYNLSKKQQTVLLAMPALLFLLCYLSLCFNNNIWTDEGFTIELLKEDFAGIIRGTASDVHPPLYYLIAKCATLVFGDGLFLLKLVSILPMVLCMTVGAGIVWKRFGLREAVLFSVFLGVIPCTMEYAVQVRMYSWAIFFVTFMALWAYEAYLEGKWRYYAGIILASAAAAYTHYFAFVSVILVYGFLFLALAAAERRELGKWLLSVGASLLLYAPWIPYMRLQIKGVSRNYWIEEITGETVKEFFPFLFDMGIPGTTLIWLSLLAVSLLLAVRMIVSGQRDMAQQGRARGIFALLCLLTPVFTAVTGIVASALIRPVFIVRYLLPCMGLLALFAAITLAAYAGKAVYAALLFFLLCAGGVDYGQSIYREYEWTHTKETEEFLAANVGEHDIIAYNYESYKFIYDYYWSDDQKILWQEVNLDDNDYDTIWLLDTIYWPTPTDPYLAEHGWQKEFMGNYGIEHNDFKIYKIERISH